MEVEERKTLNLFLQVRERFDEVKEMVSLIKPYFELICFSSGWALKLEEFERMLGQSPECLYRSKEHVYAISVLYRIDDEAMTGIIARKFSEIVARGDNTEADDLIDRICAERGFGGQLLYALENDILSGTDEREFLVNGNLGVRVQNLKKMLRGCL